MSKKKGISLAVAFDLSANINNRTSKLPSPSIIDCVDNFFSPLILISI